jgi:hypothetical protein
MVERNSGYPRMPGETYVTPTWVYRALYTVEPWARRAWDCAPVNAKFDFLSRNWRYKRIATNPPFNLAPEFCRHALRNAEQVAMLLSVHFDTARGRRDLFSDCKSFKAKYVLTRRIRWENLIQQKAGPSQNHAWYVWDRNHVGPPRLGWLHDDQKGKHRD